MTEDPYSRQYYQKLLERGGSCTFQGMTIFYTGLERLKYAIRHHSVKAKWPTTNEYYEDMEECITDFLALVETRRQE